MIPNKQKIIDAIRGAFVADAASMGTHWYYKIEELMKVVPSAEAPEFKDPPQPQFYSSEEFPGHYGPGAISPYGEQLLFVTEYCAKKGEVVQSDMSNAMKEWGNTFGGRPDHALKQFLECANAGEKSECGVDDSQAHCFMKAVPVTCLYAGKEDCASRVEAAIRVHQDNQIAVDFGVMVSKILESVLLGKTLEEALQGAMDSSQVDKVKAALTVANDAVAKKSTLEDTISAVGRGCGLPGSFIGPAQQMKSAAGESSSDDVYAKAIRDNILVGGDSCSRAVLVGAVLGAAYGGPPQSWVDKVDKSVMEKVDAAAESIATHSCN